LKAAHEFSECLSSKRGGNLGNFSTGMMHKPFEDAVKSLKENEMSQIVKTD
jgi:parvulin-like peptidyl-prolyl isomerase